MVLVRTRPSVRHRATDWPTSSLLREFESLFRDAMPQLPPLRGDRAYPAVNVSQDADAYHLRAELPGMVAEDLDLTVDQNKVTLRGSRHIPDEADGVSVHRRERIAGSFARTIALPGDIAADLVEATYRNGVLVVTVPKAPEAKPRQINVNVS